MTENEFEEMLKENALKIKELCDDAISRDDVWEILMRSDFVDNFTYEQFKDRLEALHSVTQKLTECEDAISREAVVCHIRSYIHEIITESGRDKNAHTNRVLRSIIEEIETMSPVTPMRGRMLLCRSCGLDVHSSFKNCPRCGAEMG